LEVFYFLFLVIDIFLNLDFSLLIFRSFIKYSLFFLIIFLELLILSSELLIDINKIVDFLVQYINVSQQVIVLLFSFDKSVLNLNNICKSSCFFYRIKGFINNLHVSLIVINELDFFFVVDNQFSQPLLQNCSSIILYCIDFSSFDSASSIQLRIFELFVELGKSTVVIGFVFLVLHFQAQHQILTHIAGILA